MSSDNNSKFLVFERGQDQAECEFLLKNKNFKTSARLLNVGIQMNREVGVPTPTKDY